MQNAQMPVSYYKNVGVNVEEADTEEVLLEKKGDEAIGLVYVLVENNTGGAESVTLKAGDIDDSPVTIMTKEVSDGDTSVLIDSPLGLKIDGDLIVEATSTDLNISVWGVA